MTCRPDREGLVKAAKSTRRRTISAASIETVEIRSVLPARKP
jgi:hypothetical protein